MHMLVMLAAAATLSFAAVRERVTSVVPDFRPLEFLVGSCWTGTFPDGKATDEHCFEWVFDHKFIRDRHVVGSGEGGGRYQGESLFGWSDKEQRVAFWYWNSNG